MNVKVFAAMTEKGLEKKVNRFLSDGSLDVKEVQYSSTIFNYSVLIVYGAGI